MGTGQELEEDGRVDRQVSDAIQHKLRSAPKCAFSRCPATSNSPANTDTPQGVEHADGSKVGRTGSDKTEDGSDSEGTVEGPFSTDNVTSET